MGEPIAIEPPHPNAGRRLFVAVAAMMLFIVSLSGYVVWWRWNESKDDCMAAVNGRDDARAMFVWIGEAFPDAEFVKELRVELDARLPRLRCVGDQPTPIPTEEP